MNRTLDTSEPRNLESVARPLLDVLHKVTNLDSTYLTEVNEPQNEQRIMFSQNAGSFTMPEGLVVEWADTLCKRAIDTGTCVTTDVPTTFPDSVAAKELGLQTYLSVPVRDENDNVVGTLCGASDRVQSVDEATLNIMELFAKLIADQWRRDAEAARASERAADAEKKLRDRALFLAESEHKLKSPLTIIRGWSSMLTEESDAMSEDDKLQAIDHIKKAADTLTTQLDDLLEEARGEVIVNSLKMTNVDVGQLLARIAGELSGVSTKHEVSQQVDGQIEVVSDENALWHIISHLGENAIKYSPNGGIVKLLASEDNGWVSMVVEDIGPGLPEDIDVFEPFVRGNTEIAGSGLGLHIVKSLTRAIGGDVAYVTKQGQGTTFTIRIPSRQQLT